MIANNACNAGLPRRPFALFKSDRSALSGMADDGFIIGHAGMETAALDHSTFTVPIAPRPNCQGLYMSSTNTAGCR